MRFWRASDKLGFFACTKCAKRGFIFKMANSLSDKKIIEGHLLLKEADKWYAIARKFSFLRCFNIYIQYSFFNNFFPFYSLHTSWLKWKPDYNNAADKFMKAGKTMYISW